MSKLQNLIERLCPEGVEYKKLGEIAKRLRGTSITATTMKKIASEEGEIKVFAGGKTVINAHLKDIPNANIITVPSVLCQSRGVIDFVYYDKPFTFKNEMWAYTLDNTISVKFIYYVLKHNVMYFRDKATAMGAFPQISIPDTEKFEIPVPPIEVQSKIVEILDNFTELEAELEADLEAELEARRKQYEYYRNQLMTFDKDKGARFDVKWMKIGDICDTLSGFPFDSSKFTSDGVQLMRGANVKRGYFDFSSELNKYWESSNGLEKYLLEPNDIIISMDGSLVGKSFCYLKEEHLPLLLVQRVARLRTQENFKYIYHYITKSFPDYVDKRKTAGAIPHISMKDINNFPIPIPPLAEQERIVSILDRFEALTTDLQSGLPAEIAARRKQYEYYREKLLTFKRKTA